MGEKGLAAFQNANQCQHFFYHSTQTGHARALGGSKTLDDLMNGQSSGFRHLSRER
jgi:hypothetical protein